MSTTDRKVHQFALFARELFSFNVSAVAINQAAVLFGAVKPHLGLTLPPYLVKGWVVECVQAFCTAIAATAQVDVQIDGVSILTALLVPVAATVVGATPGAGMVAAITGRTGLPTSTLQLKITTNGTGTLTNLMVTCTIRPYPLDNEAV